MHIIIGAVIALFVLGGGISKIRSGEASKTFTFGVLALLVCVFAYILASFIPVLAVVGKWAGAAVIVCIFIGVVKFVFGIDKR